MHPSPPPASSGLLQAPGWTDPIRSGLESALSGPPGVAAFDFDDTCLAGDISLTALSVLAARQGRDLVAEYRAACDQDVRTAYIELVHTLVAGRTEAEARSLAVEALAAGLADGRIRLRHCMRELVWALHRRAWEVWVITASPEVLVQAVAEHYGIHPHRVVGMRSAQDVGGRYLPDVLDPVTYREGKVEAIRRAAGSLPQLAAGDSHSDEPLLASARYSLLIDHGDPALRAVALAAGWWVQPVEALR